jgi:hypothetical protein
MKVLLISYNPSWISQKQLTDLFDLRREIRNWIAPFPGAVLVAVQEGTTPTHIQQMVGQGFPGAWFVVAEIDGSRTDGRTAQKVWDFINTPKSSGKWEATASKTLGEILAGMTPKETEATASKTLGEILAGRTPKTEATATRSLGELLSGKTPKKTG